MQQLESRQLLTTFPTCFNSPPPSSAVKTVQIQVFKCLFQRAIPPIHIHNWCCFFQDRQTWIHNCSQFCKKNVAAGGALSQFHFHLGQWSESSICSSSGKGKLRPSLHTSNNISTKIIPDLFKINFISVQNANVFRIYLKKFKIFFVKIEKMYFLFSVERMFIVVSFRWPTFPCLMLAGTATKDLCKVNTFTKGGNKRANLKD